MKSNKIQIHEINIIIDHYHSLNTKQEKYKIQIKMKEIFITIIMMFYIIKIKQQKLCIQIKNNFVELKIFRKIIYNQKSYWVKVVKQI